MILSSPYLFPPTRNLFPFSLHARALSLSHRQHGSPRHASPHHSPPSGLSPRPRDASSQGSDDEDDASMSGGRSVAEIPSLMDLSVARPAASVSSPLLPLPTPKPEILPLVPPPSSSQGTLSSRFRQSPTRRASPLPGFHDPYDSPHGSGMAI